MLPSGYLTDRQLEIWVLLRKGLSKAEIGRRLGITRQAVYDAEVLAVGKVESALRHASEANMIEPRFIDSKKGVLLGYSPSTDNRVIVTFSIRHGVQTWHYEQPECDSYKWADRCRRRLKDEAEERGVELPHDSDNWSPSELAHYIFSKVIPGLTP